jgi:predicted amidohydrolase
MPQRVKVAAVQCPSELSDVAGNMQRLMALIRQAAAGGAKIVVLPEMAIAGYASQDLRRSWHVAGRPMSEAFLGQDPLPCSQTVPGRASDQFCALARQLGIYLTIPLLERTHDDPPKFFNTVCLASPEGTLALHYRKLNPWYPERSWATPGDRGLQALDTEFGRVGLAICFDIHTILEEYADRGLWALLFSSAWVDDHHAASWMWRRPEVASRFGHHVIGANWSVDRPQTWSGYGYSTILSSAGEMLATAKTLYGSEIVNAELPFP